MKKLILILSLLIFTASFASAAWPFDGTHTKSVGLTWSEVGSVPGMRVAYECEEAYSDFESMPGYYSLMSDNEEDMDDVYTQYAVMPGETFFYAVCNAGGIYETNAFSLDGFTYFDIDYKYRDSSGLELWLGVDGDNWRPANATYSSEACLERNQEIKEGYNTFDWKVFLDGQPHKLSIKVIDNDNYCKYGSHVWMSNTAVLMGYVDEEAEKAKAEQLKLEEDFPCFVYDGRERCVTGVAESATGTVYYTLPLGHSGELKPGDKLMPGSTLYAEGNASATIRLKPSWYDPSIITIKPGEFFKVPEPNKSFFEGVGTGLINTWEFIKSTPMGVAKSFVECNWPVPKEDWRAKWGICSPSPDGWKPAPRLIAGGYG
ncbi:MAG: hypothetical protein GOV15_01580 [Candidatus Diapherotrites archaeon]|nr:hypothetical protein [Candidatus Diapherotrites archaeon]